MRGVGIDKGKKVLGLYNLNSRNQVIEHLFYEQDTLVSKETAKYNENDSLIEYKRYGKNGSLSSMKQFQYDANNRLIYSKDVYESWQREEQIEYSAGKLIKSKKIFDTLGRHIYTWHYKYDENKKLAQILEKNEQDKNHQDKTVYEYDSFGNQNKKLEYHMSDGLNFTLRTVTEYKYDSHNLLIEETRKHRKSNNNEEWYTVHHNSYKYDKQGNKTSEEEYSYYPDMKNLDYKKLVLFEYDSHGNCLKEIFSSTNEMNKPFETLEKSVAERKIIYYE
jgi:hypothetical protein